MGRRLSSRWGFGLLSCIITLGSIGLLVLAGIIWHLPSVKLLANTPLQAPLRVYTKQGDLIAEYGEKQRIPVPIQRIPKPLIQAVICTEDQRFYRHYGVDLISLARAMKMLVITGEKRQGASTITMQVARNFFLTRHKTFLRKFQEILLAIKLEQYLTKDQILALYLNKIFFGMRAYGVAAAARNYYGKTLHALTLPEMAMLAGLPQAPSRNNPIVNPTQAIKRRNHVLKKMFEQKVISQDRYLQAIQAPITAARHGVRATVNAPYVGELVRQQVVAMFGKTSAYNAGLTVYTTIDTTQQLVANRVLIEGLLAYTKRHGFKPSALNLIASLKTSELLAWQNSLKTMPTVHALQPAVVIKINKQNIQAMLKNGKIISLTAAKARWALFRSKQGFRLKKHKTFADIMKVSDVIYVRQSNRGFWQLEQLPNIQAALISMDPNTGDVKSLVGGFSYKLSEFNRVVQANRQPGSCMKPFIYAAALDYEHQFNAATIINDAPVVQEDSGENRLWRPENDNRTFYGPTRLREGLVHSRNLVSIRILRAIGVAHARQYIEKFGFDLMQQPNGLSLALGAGSVTPLALNTAFAAFANGGFKVKPVLISAIVNQHMQTLYQASTFADHDTQSTLHNLSSVAPHKTRIISEATAFIMADMLKDVIQRGTGRRARVLQRNDIAGKTGTTNKKVDAWFAGFTPHLVATVWVGFDQAIPMHEFGSQAALPIWINFMKQTLKQSPQQWLEMPENIIQVSIDPSNGHPSHSPMSIVEFFRKDHLPDKIDHTTIRALKENKLLKKPEVNNNIHALDTLY